MQGFHLATEFVLAKSENLTNLTDALELSTGMRRAVKEGTDRDSLPGTQFSTGTKEPQAWNRTMVEFLHRNCQQKLS